MTGTYEHSFDAKGRLFIPSKLREELGASFYVTIGASRDAAGQIERYLTFYPQEVWDELSAKVASQPSGPASMADVFFANAAKCEPDNQSRVMIPQKLRAYAGLDREVVIAGNNNKAKIWDAAVWNRKESAALDPERVADMMELLGI